MMEKDSCTWILTQLVGIAKDNGNAKVTSLQTSPIVWRRGGFSASAHREASESQQGQRYQLAGGDAALAPDLSFLSVETVRVAIDAWNWLWVGTSEQVSTVSVYQVSLNQRLIKTDRSWWEVDGKLSSGRIGWDAGLVYPKCFFGWCGGEVGNLFHRPNVSRKARLYLRNDGKEHLWTCEH